MKETASIRRVQLFSPESAGQGGIGDFSANLSKALNEIGVASSTTQEAPVPSRLGPHDAVALNYQPYLFGRQGFSPRLLAWIARMPRTHLVVIAHELFTEGTTRATRAREAAQRRQLTFVASRASVVFATCEQWVRILNQVVERPARLLPVGTNIPRVNSEREEARSTLLAALRIPFDAFITIEFGTPHPSKDAASTNVALHELRRTCDRPVHHLVVGQGARDPRSGATVHDLGFLDAPAASQALLASDLQLAPFIDGVSLRRTSVMAGFAHGLAVATNWEPSSDACLRSVASQGIGDYSEFVASLVDDHVRSHLAQQQQALFDRELRWSRIADRFAVGLRRRRA